MWKPGNPEENHIEKENERQRIWLRWTTTSSPKCYTSLSLSHLPYCSWGLWLVPRPPTCRPESWHILRPKIRESKGCQAKEVFAAEHILRYFVLQYSNFQNIWGNFEENLMDGKTNFRQEVPLNPLLPIGWKDFSEPWLRRCFLETCYFVAMLFWGWRLISNYFQQKSKPSFNS